MLYTKHNKKWCCKSLKYTYSLRKDTAWEFARLKLCGVPSSAGGVNSINRTGLWAPLHNPVVKMLRILQPSPGDQPPPWGTEHWQERNPTSSRQRICPYSRMEMHCPAYKALELTLAAEMNAVLVLIRASMLGKSARMKMFCLFVLPLLKIWHYSRSPGERISSSNIPSLIWSS